MCMNTKRDQRQSVTEKNYRGPKESFRENPMQNPDDGNYE